MKKEGVKSKVISSDKLQIENKTIFVDLKENEGGKFLQIALGAVGGPKWEGLDYSIRPERALLALRKELGLFANLRPAKIYPVLADASTLKKEVIDGEKRLHLLTRRMSLKLQNYGERLL